MPRPLGFLRASAAALAFLCALQLLLFFRRSSTLLRSSVASVLPPPHAPLGPNSPIGGAENGRPNVHLVYSVGCDGGSSAEYQLLQSIALDHSWAKHRQRGRLTRLVSGCVHDEEKKAMMRMTPLGYGLERFDVWFSERKERMESGEVYLQFNRPNAFVDFLTNYPDAEDGTIFVMLDPDFVFLRSIPEDVIDMVGQRRPVAGSYSLGTGWLKWAADVCEKAFKDLQPSECRKLFSSITTKQSRENFEAGAPYFMYRQDWLTFLPTWMKAMPPTFKHYSGIESDMFAYMITSVRLGMPHFISSHFMNTCMISDSKNINDDDVFIHYCQRFHTYENRGEKYYVNDFQEFLSPNLKRKDMPPYTYTFSKYWMQAGRGQLWISACESPILIEPPSFPQEMVATFPAKILKHHQILHFIVPAINDALVAFKTKYCPDGTANIEKRVILHESHTKNDHKLFSILQ